MAAAVPLIGAAAGAASGFLNTGSPSQSNDESTSQSTSKPSVFTPSPSGYSDAAQTYSDSTSQALSALNSNLNMTRTDDAPYLQAGYSALDSLLDSVGVSRPTAGTAQYGAQTGQDLAASDSASAAAKAQSDYQANLVTYNNAQANYQNQLTTWQNQENQVQAYNNYINGDYASLSPSNQQVVMQRYFPNGKPQDPGPQPVFTAQAPTPPSTTSTSSTSTTPTTDANGNPITSAATTGTGTSTASTTPVDMSMTPGGSASEQAWAAQNINTNNPAYQFDLQQGLGAVTSNAAAKGMLNSGAFATDLNNYAQGAASTEFNRQQTNMQNILLQIASGGQTAANTNAGANETGGTVASGLIQTQGTNVAQAQEGASQYWNVGPVTQQQTSQTSGSATGATQGSPTGNAITGAIKGLQSGIGSLGG